MPSSATGRHPAGPAGAGSHAGHIRLTRRSGTVPPSDLARPDRRPAPHRGRTAAALATITAAVVVAVLWVGVATGTLLAAVDPVVTAWLVGVRPDIVVSAARIVSQVGQPAVMIGLLVVVTVVVARQRRSWAPVGLGAGALVLLGALDNSVKILVARPRPPLVWQAMPAHGASFPSGHALWSAGVVLIVVVLLGARRGRPVLVALAVLVAVLVAAARLVLAVHYPSDVLAGWGLAVVADGLVILAATYRGTASRDPHPAGTRAGRRRSGPAG